MPVHNLVNIFWLSAIFFLPGFGGFSQNAPNSVERRLHAEFLSQELNKGFSGVVVVKQGQNFLFSHAYGMANDKKHIRNSLETQFMIASLSKGFTAASILKLEEKGLLSVDDLIGKYLPDLPIHSWENVTVRHLLTHTSGIPDYLNDFPLAFQIRYRFNWHPAREKLIGSFADRPLLFEPGDSYSYSNSGYVLLGQIIEKISGMSYEEFLEKNIFEPIGMNHTSARGFHFANNGAVAYKRGYFRRKKIRNLPHEAIFGMGSLHSTAGDLLKWVESIETDKILSKEEREKMLHPLEYEQGMGWFISHDKGYTTVEHGGYFPGWNSYIFHIRDDSLSIVTLANYDKSSSETVVRVVQNVLESGGIWPSIPPIPMNKQLGELPSEGRFYPLSDQMESIPAEYFSSIDLENNSELSIRFGAMKKLIFEKNTNDWYFNSEMNLWLKISEEDTYYRMTISGEEWEGVWMKEISYDNEDY